MPPSPRRRRRVDSGSRPSEHRRCYVAGCASPSCRCSAPCWAVAPDRQRAPRRARATTRSLLARAPRGLPTRMRRHRERASGRAPTSRARSRAAGAEGASATTPRQPDAWALARGSPARTSAPLRSTASHARARARRRHPRHPRAVSRPVSLLRASSFSAARVFDLGPPSWVLHVVTACSCCLRWVWPVFLACSNDSNRARRRHQFRCTGLHAVHTSISATYMFAEPLLPATPSGQGMMPSSAA
jgi:hypothetical protein